MKAETMKLLSALLVVTVIFVFVTTIKSFWLVRDEPWVIEANNAYIVVPTYGEAIGKTVRNSIHGRLTQEQTETFASAMETVTKAVYYSNLENWTGKLKGEFLDADVTLFYKFLVENSIEDPTQGFSAIRDWEVSPTAIAFTLYCGMWNEKNDGYWEGDEDYDINFRYYFARDDQLRWVFLKNEFVGFSHER